MFVYAQEWSQVDALSERIGQTEQTKHLERCATYTYNLFISKKDKQAPWR